MALCIQSLTLTPLNDEPTNVNGNEFIAMYCSIESVVVTQIILVHCLLTNLPTVDE